MKVLVTGANGFIGRNLVESLQNDGYATQEQYQLQSFEVHRFMGDIRDFANVKHQIDAIEPDAIVHLAAYGNSSYHNDEQKTYETNVLGAINLARACIGCARVIVNIGSSSEYGVKNEPMHPNMTCRPQTAYAVSKMLATDILSKLATDTKVITLRLFSVYGKYEAANRLIPTLFDAAKNRRKIQLEPTAKHDFVHVDDVVGGIKQVLINHQYYPSGSVYHLASAQMHSNLQVLRIAEQVTGETIEYQKVDTKLRTYDNDVWVSAKSALLPGLDPKDLTAGLKKTWMQNN